jgi:predicted nucleic acid-binding protein
VAGELYLIDSNVLIRWVQPGDSSFSLCRASIRQLERSGDLPCYISQNVGEFWNALTRPANRNGYGLSPETADTLAQIVESSFRLLPDDLAVHETWRKLPVTHRVSGTQVHDARLAAAMLVHGVKHILTFNTKDFARFADIEAVHPADLARTGARE